MVIPLEFGFAFGLKSQVRVRKSSGSRKLKLLQTPGNMEKPGKRHFLGQKKWKLEFWSGFLRLKTWKIAFLVIISSIKNLEMVLYKPGKPSLKTWRNLLKTENRHLGNLTLLPANDESPKLVASIGLSVQHV